MTAICKHDSHDTTMPDAIVEGLRDGRRKPVSGMHGAALRPLAS